MDSKIGAAAVLLTSVVLGFAGGSVMTQTARAQEGAGPNTSCGSTLACLVESNTSSGAGIKSTSTRGNGLVATTKALGSTSSNGASALFGQDLQTTTGDGIFNIGVNGTSKNGTGVQGLGGSVGVAAVTSSTTGTAIRVQAPPSSLKTSLINGTGYNGLTVFSLDSVGNAVFGDAGIGAGGSVTARSYSGNGLPLFVGATEQGTIFQLNANGAMVLNGSIEANVLASYSGLALHVNSPLAADYGLIANSVTSNDGLFSNERTNQTNTIASDASGVIWLYQGYSATAGKYTVEMGDSGSVYARTFITMSAPRVAQRTSTGARVDTYTPQIAQPSLEDFGEAQLTEGFANIPLDPRFAAAIDSTMRYFVTLTPEGDCRGLYVARRDRAGFTVRELQGGQSSIAFTYRIVARPLGDHSARLPVSTLPYGFDQKVPPPQAQRAPHRALGSHRR